MANFDSILASLHDSAILIDEQADSPIVITSRRTYEVPQNYDLVLGYAGDVNSQIVTFELPNTHETHSLSLCANKKLKWKNLASGAEGVSNLIIKEKGEEPWTAAWEVPAESMTVAGQLEIAISLYALSDGKTAFAWNTPPYKGFSIGEGFIKVADVLENDSIPSKDEILIVDIESRNIIAPVGYNYIMCSYGDIGIAKIFFEINQYIRGINLLDEATKVYVNVAYQTITAEPFRVTNIKPMFASVDNKKSNKVLITWDVPDVLTNNAEGYTGIISISLKIEVDNEQGNLAKRWSTSSFGKLTIGPSVLLNDVTELISRDEGIVERVVDEALEEGIEGMVDEKIDNYMDNTTFEISDN